MTYCVAVKLQGSLIFVSDSRTNAGVDQVNTYSKLYTWGIDGERQVALLSAGNLATTQAVAQRLRREMDDPASETSLLSLQRMDEVADYVGRVSREEQSRHADGGQVAGFNPEATFILGGQIKGQPSELYLIYPQGNHIRPSDSSPFLQIGEVKYGKPILDRIIRPDTPLEDAVRCALVSMDSTMRSNATVGPPIELLIYADDTLRLQSYLRLGQDDPYLAELRLSWNQNLLNAFRALPMVDMDRLEPPPQRS